MRPPLRRCLIRAVTRGALLACYAVALHAYAQEVKKAPPLPQLPPVPPKSAPAQIAAPPYPPNAIDLKAAYCRPVVAASMAEQQRALNGPPPNQQQAAKERLAATVERGRRLEFYLLPRLNTLQSAPLLDAQGRGYTDVASLLELSRACEAKCSGTGDAAAVGACRLRCREGGEAAKRARECDDIAWLPLKDL